MYYRILIIVIGFVLLFPGCNFIPEEEDRFAQSYLHSLKDGNFEQSLTYVDNDLIQPDSLEKFRDVIRAFADLRFRSIKNIGSNVQDNQTGKQSLLTYELDTEKGWVLTTVVINRSSGSLKIAGFHWYRIPKSIEETTAFTFSEKSVWHFLTFGIGVLIATFTIGTTIICALSKVHNKWIWILFVGCGIGQMNFNWTNGDIDFNMLYIQLFGAGLWKQGIYASWILSISIPVGAIIFLIKRKRLVDEYRIVEAPRTIRKFQWSEKSN